MSNRQDPPTGVVATRSSGTERTELPIGAQVEPGIRHSVRLRCAMIRAMPVADPSLTVRVRTWQVLLLSAAACLAGVVALAVGVDGVHKGAGWLGLLMGLVFPRVTPTQVVVSSERFIVRHWWGSRTYEAGRCDINRTTMAMPFHRSHSLVMLRRFGDLT